MSDVEPIERRPWEDVADDVPHVWRTLGYRRPVAEPGRVVVEWDAAAEFAFPVDSGHIVHGGLVATILDTAMGGACWTLLGKDETFLTADLRVEFLRATRPGLVRARRPGRAPHQASHVLRSRASRRGRHAPRERPLHAGAAQHSAGRRPQVTQCHLALELRSARWFGDS